MGIIGRGRAIGMHRAKKMCGNCPFQGIGKTQMRQDWQFRQVSRMPYRSQGFPVLDEVIQCLDRIKSSTE